MKKQDLTLEQCRSNYYTLNEIYNLKYKRYQEAKSNLKRTWYEMLTARENLNYFIKKYGKFPYTEKEIEKQKNAQLM